MSALTVPTPSLHTTPPPTTHSAVRLRGVPNKGIFVLTHTTSPITWNGTTATLGWVTLDNQSWTVRAHVDAARYGRYDQGLAATPALINGPDLHAISYPVKEREDATRRLLLHAPHFLTWKYPGVAGPIDWKTRELADGRVVHEATLVAIEDHIGLVPVGALHDPHLVDLAHGDVGDMVMRVGKGFERRFILPVNSMDVTRQELFQRLADLGSFD